MPPFDSLPSQVLTLPATAAASTSRLDVRIQAQLGTNWCWAAVAASVSEFYTRHGGGTTYTQCQLASRVLSDPPPAVAAGACCASHGGQQMPGCPGLTKRYNQEAQPKTALHTIGHLQEPVTEINPPDTPPPDFFTIQHEIKGGRPVCVRFQFSDSGDTGDAHLLIICDAVAVPGGPNVLVLDDPEYAQSGPVTQSVEALPTTYRNRSGAWTHAYFTQ
jgi:hypothetical protein